MALQFSKLNNTVVNDNAGPDYPHGWNNIKLSDVTMAHRKQLKMGMDDFTGFSWRGVNAFEVFGAFIINNKDSLKFYNGPTYSNEYTKPMFESAAGQLTGVTFSQQKIDFTIGVYWISEDHYRQLIYWLHPYEINTLTFDFEPDWYYQVKLASVEDGNRRVVGAEIVNGEKVYMYYTEMKITFEVQGPNCAYRKIAYEIAYNSNTGEGTIESVTNWNTDLPTPFQLTFDIILNNISSSGTCSVEFGVKYPDSNSTMKTYQLGYLSLENLTQSDQNISIKYDSDTGLCFWNHGESAYFLLNRLSTLSTGKRFVDALNIKSYNTEGVFDKPSYNINNLVFYIIPKVGNMATYNLIRNVGYTMRARTNLI